MDEKVAELSGLQNSSCSQFQPTSKEKWGDTGASISLTSSSWIEGQNACPEIQGQCQIFGSG